MRHDIIKRVILDMQQMIKEKKDMNKLNVDAFLAWADQFDGAELFLHMKDFVTMYLGSRQTTSVPKKGVSRPTGK